MVAVGEVGWVTGFEPATSGATVRRSTAELHPPSSKFSVLRSEFSVLNAGSRARTLRNGRSVVYANKNGEAPPSGVAGNVPRLNHEQRQKGVSVERRPGVSVERCAPGISASSPPST
jgi:hypothetical protein